MGQQLRHQQQGLGHHPQPLQQGLGQQVRHQQQGLGQQAERQRQAEQRHCLLHVGGVCGWALGCVCVGTWVCVWDTWVVCVGGHLG